MGLELRNERRDDGIATLWLASPGRALVVIDAWLLDQLHLFFDDLERQSAPAGLIIMSTGKVFVAGADLAEIDQLPDDQLLAYLTEGAEAFGRIAALGCPTVAAISGAALGGGLELALHCDGLVAAKPALGAKSYRLGLPEASLGLCPGWGGTQMLPARIDPATAIAMTAAGKTKKLEELPAGLIDRVVDNEVDLHEAAIHWIESNASATGRGCPRSIDESNRDGVAAGLQAARDRLPDTPAAHAVVEAIEIGIAEGWAAALAAERRLLVSLRHTEAARSGIGAFLAKQA
jgi:3-hydroxyacyl-CoA dehydrogenase/enoyl-CoA hydratase/3-hydroxybutyryl-CoA epimerase/enoyl-CoA isomerase